MTKTRKTDDTSKPSRDQTKASPAPANDNQIAPVRSPQAARWTLLVLTILALVLVALVVQPFASALFVAAVGAGAIYPWYDRLARGLRGRRQLSATVTVIAVLLIVILPLAAISVTVAREVGNGVNYVRTTLRSQGVEGLVRDLPGPLQTVARKALGELPDPQDLQTLAQQQGGRAAAAVGGVLSATSGAIFQLVMMLIAFYFFLVDGPDLVRWLEDVMPLRRGQTARLLWDFRQVSVAVIVSSVVTAAIQAAVAFVGYLLAGVPNALFFAIVTLVVGMIPALGAGAVALVAAALLYFSGHPGAALFLAIWGLVAVGLIDNIVKPYLIRGGVELHGAVVFFALLGGVACFGAVGLLAGPLIVSFFLAVIRMWDRDDDVPA